MDHNILVVAVYYFKSDSIIGVEESSGVSPKDDCKIVPNAESTYAQGRYCITNDMYGWFININVGYALESNSHLVIYTDSTGA